MAKYFFNTNESILIPYDSSAAYLDYAVTEGGADIFSGRAYRLPEQSSITVDLTDILSPLSVPPDITIPDSLHPAGWADTKQQRVYTVSAAGHGDDTVTVSYYNVFDEPTDVSLYEHGRKRYVSNRFLQADTVGRHGMFVFDITAEADPGPDSSIDYFFDIDRGDTTLFDLGEVVYASGLAVTVDFAKIKDASVGDTVTFSTGGGSTPDRVHFKGRIVDDTGRFTLYWQNPIGGTDWLMCTGKRVKSVKAVRHAVTVPVRKGPDNISAFGTANYQTDATVGWQLNTGLLDDRQSELFADIFTSGKVWLLDNDRHRLYAVNLTDTSAEVRKFSTHKMVNYTVNVEFAQTVTSH